VTKWKQAYEEGEARLADALQRNLALSLSQDALKRENEKLRDRIKRMFDRVCEANAALEKRDSEKAAHFIARAKLAANS